MVTRSYGPIPRSSDFRSIVIFVGCKKAKQARNKSRLDHTILRHLRNPLFPFPHNFTGITGPRICAMVKGAEVHIFMHHDSAHEQTFEETLQVLDSSKYTARVLHVDFDLMLIKEIKEKVCSFKCITELHFTGRPMNVCYPSSEWHVLMCMLEKWPIVHLYLDGVLQSGSTVFEGVGWKAPITRSLKVVRFNGELSAKFMDDTDGKFPNLTHFHATSPQPSLLSNTIATCLVLDFNKKLVNLTVPHDFTCMAVSPIDQAHKNAYYISILCRDIWKADECGVIHPSLSADEVLCLKRTAFEHQSELYGTLWEVMQDLDTHVMSA